MLGSYATGKFGGKEYLFDEHDPYRFKLKNGKWGKKLWQIELTPEQQQKVRDFMSDEERGSVFNIEQYWKDNAPYDADARRGLYRGLKDLFSIYKFMESMGDTIHHWEDRNATAFSSDRGLLQKSTFEELLDYLGIEWQSKDWVQPGVMPVFLRIRNPLDADKPFPSDLLAALKEASKRERIAGDEKEADLQWTKAYPLKSWVRDIEEGNEFWTTHIPAKALPIIKRFGYDGFRERGTKGAETPREQRGINWIAFDPEQIKSATGNRGTFDPASPNILHAKPREFADIPLSVQEGMAGATPQEAQQFRAEIGNAIRAADQSGIPGAREEAQVALVQAIRDHQPVEPFVREHFRRLMARPTELAPDAEGVEARALALAAEAEASAVAMARDIEEASAPVERRAKVADIYNAHLRGRFDKLNYFAEGSGALLQEAQMKAADWSAAMRIWRENLEHKVSEAFGHPSYWRNKGNRERLKHFSRALLPYAAVLNPTSRDEAGDFVFEDFWERHGEATKAQLAQHKPGTRWTDDRGVRWRIGKNPITPDPKKPTETFYQVERFIPAPEQERLHQEFWETYPEAAWLLDDFIEPGQEDARVESPNGVQIPTFNRTSLWGLYGDTPAGFVEKLPGYTPDVARTKKRRGDACESSLSSTGNPRAGPTSQARRASKISSARSWRASASAPPRRTARPCGARLPRSFSRRRCCRCRKAASLAITSGSIAILSTH